MELPWLPLVAGNPKFEKLQEGQLQEGDSFFARPVDLSTVQVALEVRAACPLRAKLQQKVAARWAARARNRRCDDDSEEEQEQEKYEEEEEQNEPQPLQQLQDGDHPIGEDEHAPL